MIMNENQNIAYNSVNIVVDILVVAALILTLNKIKAGVIIFYSAIIISAICAIIMYSDYPDYIIRTIAVGLLYSLMLLFKKNGISGWSLIFKK